MRTLSIASSITVLLLGLLAGCAPTGGEPETAPEAKPGKPAKTVQVMSTAEDEHLASIRERAEQRRKLRRAQAAEEPREVQDK
jgi:hypothetical protein